jgi:hypothetical protein
VNPLDDRRLPELPVREADLESAWAQVVRRRSRRNQITGGLSVVALFAVVTAALALPNSGHRPPAEVEVAAPRVDMRTPEPEEEAQAEGPGAPRTGGRTGSAAKPAGSPAPRGETPRPPSGPSAARPTSKPELDRKRSQTLLIGCFDFCVGARIARDGEEWVLTSQLCVAVGTRTRQFTYATLQEIDLTISETAGSEPLWRWSTGQQFPASEHQLDLASGECMVWSAPWLGTDENGEPLEPGSYTFTTKNFADEVADRSTSSTTFQID